MNTTHPPLPKEGDRARLNPAHARKAGFLPGQVGVLRRIRPDREGDGWLADLLFWDRETRGYTILDPVGPYDVTLLREEAGR